AIHVRLYAWRISTSLFQSSFLLLGCLCARRSLGPRTVPRVLSGGGGGILHTVHCVPSARSVNRRIRRDLRRDGCFSGSPSKNQDQTTVLAGQMAGTVHQQEADCFGAQLPFLIVLLF